MIGPETRHAEQLLIEQKLEFVRLAKKLAFNGNEFENHVKSDTFPLSDPDKRLIVAARYLVDESMFEYNSIATAGIAEIYPAGGGLFTAYELLDIGIFVRRKEVYSKDNGNIGLLKSGDLDFYENQFSDRHAPELREILDQMLYVERWNFDLPKEH